jgi:hypothetical protein
MFALIIICSQKQQKVITSQTVENCGYPVRSAILQPPIDKLVVEWVSTSEYLLLYVFCFFDHCVAYKIEI